MATEDQKPAPPEKEEIASIRRDPGLQYFGNTLQHQDDTLITRGGAKGYRIYDELERDAHAGAVLDKRKSAVTSRPFEVTPASDAPNDVAAADLVRDCLEKIRLTKLAKNMLDATLKGFSVGEVMWAVRDGFVVPASVIPREQRRFVFDLDNKLRLKTRQAMIEGEELPPRKFIVHTFGGKDGTPYGLGLGSKLFWPVFFKKKGITFWLTFADKFGSPTAKGVYPKGATADEQKKLLQALQAISQDAGVIIPEGMVIELIEAARSGTVDTYEKLCRYMDEQISKAVLGETMSTTASSAGLGSGQANVHNDVRKELAEDDAGDICDTLQNSLVQWIVEFNFPGAALPTVEFTFDEPQDLNTRADRDKKLGEMGFELTDEAVLKTYGEGYQRKPQPSATAEANGLFTRLMNTPQEVAFSEAIAAAAHADNIEAQDSMEEAANTLASEWKTTMRRRVEDLQAIAEETGDYAAFREQLYRLLDTEPPKEMVESIARARFAAHLAGRGPSRKRRTASFAERVRAFFKA